MPIRIIGIPPGAFVDHGAVSDLRRDLRLDARGITEQVREALTTIGSVPSKAVVG